MTKGLNQRIIRRAVLETGIRLGRTFAVLSFIEAYSGCQTPAYSQSTGTVEVKVKRGQAVNTPKQRLVHCI